MALEKPRPNPFYALLVIIGIAFTITAFAYGVMALKASQPGRMPSAGDSGFALMQFLDHHGLALLASEIGLLALATVGSIGLDHQRIKRQAAAKRSAAANGIPNLEEAEL